MKNIKERSPKRPILFMGPSGMGKTTLAKSLEDITGRKFISGSYFSNMSDSVKAKTQLELINMPYEDIVLNDTQNLSRRVKNLVLAMDTNESGVISDRSPIDSLVFFIQKLSVHNRSVCDIDVMVEHVKKCLYTLNPVLIFTEYSVLQFQSWTFEDNGRRVTNKYFQNMISGMFREVLDTFFWYEYSTRLSRKVGEECGYITVEVPQSAKEIKLPVLTLSEINHDSRIHHIVKFLNRVL